uniref:Col_cuticle_N domain-containing protein n=1 Tax=Caenorhabditis tropicalis TaxID=1561998 RepID=A0A1I7TUU9_9PELO
MSLDATLENINDTLLQVASLLKAVEYAVLIMAVCLGVALVGCTGAFFYGKYNQRNQYRELRNGGSPNTSRARSPDTPILRSDKV